MTDIQTLLKPTVESTLSKQTRLPVSIHLSLNEIHRYISQERNDYLIYQWCEAYIKRFNQIG